jgi:hypothetical protein
MWASVANATEVVASNRMRGASLEDALAERKHHLHPGESGMNQFELNE